MIDSTAVSAKPHKPPYAEGEARSIEVGAACDGLDSGSSVCIGWLCGWLAGTTKAEAAVVVDSHESASTKIEQCGPNSFATVADLQRRRPPIFPSRKQIDEFYGDGVYVDVLPKERPNSDVLAEPTPLNVCGTVLSNCKGQRLQLRFRRLHLLLRRNKPPSPRRSWPRANPEGSPGFEREDYYVRILKDGHWSHRYLTAAEE